MNDTPERAVEIRGLVKRYDDDEPAVDGLDLQVPKGSVLGLIGGNGAGKTTTLRTVLGLSAPTAGETFVFGESSLELSRATRQRIGYLSEDEFPYDDLALCDALAFVRGFFDRWDWDWCDHLVAQLGVDKFKRLDRMSKGQRRLAEFVIALAPSPELLVLDDPAVGLDPVARRALLRALLEIVDRRGATVLFSSHVLQDVERVVDHVAILDHGRLRASGELDDLKDRVRRVVLPASSAPDPIEGEIARQRHGDEIVIVTERWGPDLAARLEGHGADVHTLNLEELFLNLAESAVPAAEEAS